jgi:hypothetical protein
MMSFLKMILKMIYERKEKREEDYVRKDIPNDD